MKDNLTFKFLRKNSPELEEAIDLFVYVFKYETITDYTFDFSKPKTEKYFYRASKINLLLFLDKGHDVIIVKKDKRIVGIAVVKVREKNETKASLKPYLLDIISLSPLLTRIKYKNLITLSKVAQYPISSTVSTLSIIGVDSKYRGQGIGTKLFKVIHRYYADESEGIYLYTAEKKNKNLYTSLGYELLEKKKAKDLSVYHMLYGF